MHIEESKLEILNEARKHGKQIYKLKSDGRERVKVRSAYSQPDDLRTSYLAALSELIENGLVAEVFSNKDIELYELTPEGAYCTTLDSARERILDELNSRGRVYKVHGDRGEFIQLGRTSMNHGDVERILFMRALHELMYRGTVMVTSENREMTSYEFAPPSSGYVQHLLDPNVDEMPKHGAA